MGILSSNNSPSNPSEVADILANNVPGQATPTLTPTNRATVFSQAAGKTGIFADQVPDQTSADQILSPSPADINAIYDPSLQTNVAGLPPASNPAATTNSGFTGIIPIPASNAKETFDDSASVSDASSGFADTGSWAPDGISISNSGGDPGSVSGLFSNIATNQTGGISTFTNSGLQDLRVRLSALNPQVVYGPQGTTNILSPLYATGGMLFPYSPTITNSQDVDYATIDPVQNNTNYLAYTRTPAVTLNITGKFTVQNALEGQYVLACLHFLRVASKSYFGKSAGANAGLPPPMLVLNGYGTYMYNNLRVILRNHSWNYDENMDTVAVSAGGGVTRLPALFSISLVLVVQQTPAQWRDTFNIEAFRSGALLRQGGWI